MARRNGVIGLWTNTNKSSRAKESPPLRTAVAYKDHEGSLLALTKDGIAVVDSRVLHVTTLRCLQDYEGGHLGACVI